MSGIMVTTTYSGFSHLPSIKYEETKVRKDSFKNFQIFDLR